MENAYRQHPEQGAENGFVLVRFVEHRVGDKRIIRLIQKWLRAGTLSWERMTKLIADFLPRPRIRHPWPDQRFTVNHPRWEPDAGKLHVRFCAGSAE